MFNLIFSIRILILIFVIYLNEKLKVTNDYNKRLRAFAQKYYVIFTKLIQ